MSNRVIRAAAVLLGISLSLILAAPASASGPTVEHQQIEERFFDDLIFELCGIETFTTLTQTSTDTVFEDGSEQVHVVRTFRSDDPRLPVERGAGTSFIAPDGTRTVIGKPIQLIGPHGGVRLLDAGLVTFADELLVHGPHPSLAIDDLAPYYCPPNS
jgi:hypothetical protein